MTNRNCMSRAEEDIRTGIGVLAAGIAIVGMLVGIATGAIPGYQIPMTVVALAVAAPFIMRSRRTQARAAKAHREQALSQPPDPRTRLG